MVRLFRREVLAGLGAAGALAPWLAAAAQAEDVSEWVASNHARVRLIDAGPLGGVRLAGLQIELHPGYLTYWRTPGEAGLPPTADFAASGNVASATLRFPAPGKFDEGGAEAFGYKGAVLFPLVVVPREPERPMTLALDLSFAVCGTLCLPADAKLQLRLNGLGSGPEADLVRAADRLVPVEATLGAAGPLSILGVEAGATHDRARVLARAAGGITPALFVEASEPWYIRADDGHRLDGDRVAFDLQVLAGVAEPSPVDLVLTLVGGEGAVQVSARLDVAARS